MTPQLSSDRLVRLSNFVAERMGLAFPQARWAELERGVAAVARERGFNNTESCADWLLSSAPTEREIETVASHLTVGETYFFRERKSFEVFEQRILPDLVRSRRATERRLRIWSAGCATGPEPYSIAILLHKNLPDLKDWNVTLLATDINPAFLRQAVRGEFSSWAFREGVEGLNGSCFEKTGGDRRKVCRAIQQMVTFAYLNLAEDVYPSLLNNTNAMDVIFCRNVLMYFTPRSAEKVVRRLYDCLVEGGWLFVSPCEGSPSLFAQFTAIQFPEVAVYRKDAARGHSPVDAPHAALDRLPGSLPTFVEPLPAAEPSPSPGFAVPVANGAGEKRDGKAEEAQEQASSRLAREPGQAAAMGLRARVDANQGKLSEALAWCDQAIAADKLEPRYHFLRANILQEQGVLEEASRALRRALYLEPKFVLAHFALGSLALKQGRAGEARKHFDNARALAGAWPAEEVLPESEGVAAGRLTEIIARCARAPARRARCAAAGGLGE